VNERATPGSALLGFAILCVATPIFRDVLLRGRPDSAAAVAAVGYGGLLCACLVAVRASRVSWAEPGVRRLTVRSIAFGLVAGAVMAEPVWRLPHASASGATWVLVAVAIEEVVFRGVLFATLRRAGGLPLAIAGSTLAFTAAHAASAAWPSIVLVALAGICLGLLRAIRGALWASGLAPLLMDLVSLP